MKKSLLCLTLSLLLISASMAQDTTKPETKETAKVEKMTDSTDSSKKTAADSTKKEPEWIKTESGLKYRDIIVGEGVVAIIEKGDRYLMIRRPDHIRAGGYWCFVGGAIEDGETQAQALIREVREEVGLEIEPVEKVWQCLSINKDWMLHCWTTAGVADQIEANPREVADWAWLTVEEISALPSVMPSVLDYFKFRGML